MSQGKPHDGLSIPTKMRERFDVIWTLIEQFCRAHLTEEYLPVCQRMLIRLARKRPSPLINGKAESWACGIVRTIGWVNFLSDPHHQPYMKMNDVDQAFGVSAATGAA